MFGATAQFGKRLRVVPWISAVTSAVLAITLLQSPPPANADPISCSPEESIGFDGSKLNLVYDFTTVGICEWTTHPNLTGATVFTIDGGDGGSDSAGGFGGVYSADVWSGANPSAIDVVVGEGGFGSIGSVENGSSATLGGDTTVGFVVGASSIQFAITDPVTRSTSLQLAHSGLQETYGGSALQGVNGLEGTGTGGGIQRDGVAGNGGSGRVIITVPIASSANSRYVASDFVPSTSDQIGYWPEHSDPTNVARRASISGGPTKVNNPAWYGVARDTTFSVVQGRPADSIFFPEEVSDNYTFFSVARYNDLVPEGQTPRYGRIFDGTDVNWLSGFWGDRSGISYHGDWLTWAQSNQDSLHGLNWVISTDSKSLYRSNGVTRSNFSSLQHVGPGHVTINAGASDFEEYSDFQVADVLFFNRELNSNENAAVERYLSSLYKIRLTDYSAPYLTNSMTLSEGVINEPYDFILEVSETNSDILAAYDFSISSGALPDGITLSSSGRLTGTPTTTGQYIFEVYVEDTEMGLSTSATFSITITDVIIQPDPPEFLTTSLPNANINQPYSQFLQILNGSNLLFSVSEGSEFPSWLSLDAATGELTGTPTASGTFTFSITATDSSGLNASRQFKIFVGEPVTLPLDVIRGDTIWQAVGSGITGVLTSNNSPTFLSNTFRADWIPSSESGEVPIEIGCPENQAHQSTKTRYTQIQCPAMSPTDDTPGLTAAISHAFADSDPWHQFEFQVLNDAEVTRNGTLSYTINLASGRDSTIEMTSDGDLLLEDSDSWVVMSGGESSNNAVSLHYFGYTPGQSITQGEGSEVNFLEIRIPITVNANSTEIVRMVDGVIDFPVGTHADAVVTAMKAADQLEFNDFGEIIGVENATLLNSSLADVLEDDKDLPALHTKFECSDFGKMALYPVVVQSDGKPIGCSFSTNQFMNQDLNQGLIPNVVDNDGEPITWAEKFRDTFPNAAPRLGWACNDCVVTSDGPKPVSDIGSSVGLPLGFTVNRGNSQGLDSIAIYPSGDVFLHSSSNPDITQGQFVSAFGNFALGNASIQGPWLQRPEYDFFYWGRTIYQGRVAFVVTWVKIPTLDLDNSQPDNAGLGLPIPELEPTTMQLMFVSDSTGDELDQYWQAEEKPTSQMDVIWNFKSIQANEVVRPTLISASLPDFANGTLLSGFYEFPGYSTTLISDENTFGTARRPIGQTQDPLTASENCDADCIALNVAENPDLSEVCDALCVANNLLNSRLNSPVDGRYVMGYRDYEFTEGPPDISGFPAPASPRNVDVTRLADSEGDSSSATITWSPPIPWVLRELGVPADTNPIYGYRIEYSVDGRYQPNDFCSEPDETSCIRIFPELNDPPLSANDERVSISGSGESQRISVSIAGLPTDQQFTFRVYASYSGVDFPESSEGGPGYSDLYFSEEYSAPAYANEFFLSDLDITTLATPIGPGADLAQEVASLIAGEGVAISNATINGSTRAQRLSAKSFGTFTGGQDAVGFEEGVVITPLLDARTFERGSGITNTGSEESLLDEFSNPNDRQRYEEVASQYDDYLGSQESWNPRSGESGAFAPVCYGSDCAYGTSYLQFDVIPTDDFLKFEYALAGTEYESSGELYDYPDGFGLFINSIDQSGSCAVIPQTAGETIEQRFVSMGNAMNARLARLVRYDSDLHAQSVTATMTCQADVSVAFLANEPVTVTMIISNARDRILSPAVFIKSESIRFEATSIDLMDIVSATQYESYEGSQFTSTGTSVQYWGATGLPMGLVMNNSGYIEGTPLESGLFDFVVLAYDEFDNVLARQTFSIFVNASSSGPDVFLQSEYVEVGIASNGHFGSSGPAPEGFHPRDPEGMRIGFVSDRDRDGWGVGQDDGDFFVPGTPFEGFGVDVGGISYFNNHVSTDISVLSEVTDRDSERQQSTWTSEIMSNGLQVTQVAAVPVNNQRLDVTVTLTNTSGVDLEDVYYARQVDNDANVFACSANDGGWSSLNTVEAQANTSDGLSLVSSIMMDDCNDESAPTDISAPHSYLGMISSDPYSVAALQYGFGGHGFGAQKAVDFVNGVLAEDCISRGDESCLNVNITPGAQVFGDSGIGLGFDLGTIDSGETKTVTFSYILSPDQAQDIIDEHNNENNIIAPQISSNRNHVVAASDQPFELLGSQWLDYSAAGQVSYFTISPELPSGLSFDPTTGDISGTALDSSATASYTLTGHNLAGSDSIDFLLSVVGGPYLYSDNSALIANWPSNSLDSESNYEFQVSADGSAWGEDAVPIHVVPNENEPVSVVTFQLLVEPGATYQIRVRSIFSESMSDWLYSDPYFFGINSCIQGSSQLNVLMLSVPSIEESQGTRPASTDANIRNAICQSELVSLEVFDGQGFQPGAVKGSAQAWQNALDGKDVLVLPQLTSGTFMDSDLLSPEAAEVLAQWVETGGRLIFTGSAGYVDLIWNIVGGTPIDEMPTTQEYGSKREGGANSALPNQLLTYGQPGLRLWDSESQFLIDNYREVADPNGASLVSTFFVDTGSVIALSNNFEISDENWEKILKQAVHSTVSKYITVKENDNYWYLLGGELYSSRIMGFRSGVVKVGNEATATTVNCVNTPSNPAIIKRNPEGTYVNCGATTIDDGITDTPIRAQLERFFAANGAWTKTSIDLSNNDPSNAYVNSVMFGGNPGLGDAPTLESWGSQILDSESTPHNSPLLVASQGSAIENYALAEDGAMVVQVNGSTPSYVYGGVSLEGDSYFTRNQMWTLTGVELDDGDSKTFSWFQNIVSYHPGCDRIASAIAWENSLEFYFDAFNDFSVDYFDSNSQLSFPDLSTSECTSFTDSIDFVAVNDVGGILDLNWSGVESASSYEVQYRVVGSDDWEDLSDSIANGYETEAKAVTGLLEGLTYEFRIRPVQSARNFAGDTAKGLWYSSPEVYLAVLPPPSPTSSPTPTPTPSDSLSPTPTPSDTQSPTPPPTPTTTPTPTQTLGSDPESFIQPMLTQSAPGFPARLKKGKTVKFGMTAPSGLPLRVSSVGRCKTTAITKKVTVKVLVGKKIKKKKVKVQTGWAVKGTKKGLCTVTFSNSGDATRSPLAAAGTITVF